MGDWCPIVGFCLGEQNFEWISSNDEGVLKSASMIESPLVLWVWKGNSMAKEVQ